MSNRDIIYAAAGASAPPTYIEDVFSTWLYTGTGAALTINNGIDLAGKGGMTWFKGRNTATSHALFDTNRGAGYSIYSNATSAQSYFIDDLSAFNSNGFSLGDSATSGRTNASGYNYVSWTFRKQPKFFDVVTYTGTGSLQSINHSLGSIPAMIIVKNLTTGGYNWVVYHKDANAGSGASNTYMYLNTTAAAASSGAFWGGVDPTSTNFTVNTNGAVNQTGWNYVAYLFAHNAGGFGLTGTDNVISCGSFTSDGSGGIATPVNLGFEPQWLLVKNTSSDGWRIVDIMRGWSQTTYLDLSPNSSAAERDLSNNPSYLSPTATGFSTPTPGIFTANNTFIYVAIRRPMKVPTTGTSVYQPAFGTGGTPGYQSSFTVDSLLNFYTPGDYANPNLASRLQGDAYLATSNTDAELGGGNIWQWGFQTGVGSSVFSSIFIGSMFRRAPNFFDVVCYTGTGSAQNINHNLTVAPEIIICKQRSSANSWFVYAAPLGASKGISLNGAFAAFVTTGTFSLWNDTNPTSSVFSLGQNSSVNASGSTYVAYLFATCPGVSKVGSYTGTGSTQTISCGFTGGARFVLIRRTDSTGNWWFWDTARGMVAGTDPRLAMNLTSAQINNDWVYTTTGGFQIVTSDATINASGGSYIYLAIA